jgi:hypothetical protein
MQDSLRAAQQFRQSVEQQQQAEMQRAYAEDERRFRASLEGLTREEQALKIAARQNTLLRAQQGYLARQLQQTQLQGQTRELARQFTAKQEVVNVVAQEYGLPEEFIPQLMSAGTPEQLEAEAIRLFKVVQRISGTAGQPQGVPTQGQPASRQNRPVDIAGGDYPSAQVLKGPVVGSGDLDALINSTAYELRPL